MKKEKLILICVAIVAVAVISTQVIKQSSIERQTNAKIEQERQALNYQKEQDRKAELQKLYNKIDLDDCLANAEEAFWSYMELNGQGKRDDEKGIWAAQYKWDIAEDNKKADEDSCYKRYK